MAAGPYRFAKWRSRRATVSAAASQLASSSPRSPRTSGVRYRSSARTCSKANRPLSHSQPSSTSGLSRESTRRTWSSRVVAQVLQPVGQRPQTVGTLSISQGRALKR
jgi:hypothetical protein